MSKDQAKEAKSVSSVTDYVEERTLDQSAAMQSLNVGDDTSAA